MNTRINAGDIERWLTTHPTANPSQVADVITTFTMLADAYRYEAQAAARVDEIRAELVEMLRRRESSGHITDKEVQEMTEYYVSLTESLARATDRRCTYDDEMLRLLQK